MIEVAPRIFYIPGKNNSRFPYCACLYLKGKELRVLIDAGMGGGNLNPAKKMGIDVLILTHCHIDHRLTRREIPQIPVWSHDKDAPYLFDKDLFFKTIGFDRSGLDLANLRSAVSSAFEIVLSRTLADGERIDLGGISLETIHTPGHTPGHLSFFIPEHQLLFAADVDLTPFGPFYGHDFADIGNFIQSIDTLKKITAKTVLTGHAGPFSEDIAQRFEAYKQLIYERDRIVLNELKHTQSLEDLKGRNLIYRSYPPGDPVAKWFELVHIEKHLQRLVELGKVRRDAENWIRI